MRTVIATAAVSLLCLARLTAQEPTAQAIPPTSQPPFNVVASVQQLMQGVIDPASAFLWNAVHTEATEKGVREFVPQTDEEWTSLWNSALVIAESGNLLMMGRRARDRDGWMAVARALSDGGVLAMKAARAKNVNGILEAGEEIRAACQSCHRQYVPRRD
jgi:hypothetical protein